jgi:hypothetical protein
MWMLSSALSSAVSPTAAGGGASGGRLRQSSVSLGGGGANHKAAPVKPQAQARTPAQEAGSGGRWEKQYPEAAAWAAHPDSVCFGAKRAYTVLTIMHNYDPRMALNVRKNRLQYITQHGYRYCEVTENLAPAGRPAPWGKPIAINQLYQPTGRDPDQPANSVGQGPRDSELEWVVWMDSDALFVDMSQRLEAVTTQYGAGKDLIFSDQRKEHTINSGVFFSRNTEWATDFWDAISNDFPWRVDPKGCPCEQYAIIEYKDTNVGVWKEHCAVVPSAVMNTFWKDFEDGVTFIWHGYGSKGKDMVNGMPDYEPGTIKAYTRAYLKMMEGRDPHHPEYPPQGPGGTGGGP